jgi:hypothetical protein
VNDRRFVVPLAKDANQLWRDKTGLPLKYVGGEDGHEWLILYAPDYPRVINRWNPGKQYAIFNLEIKDEEINEHGALLIAPRACASDVFASTFEEHPFMKSAELVDHRFEFRGVSRPYCLGYYSPRVGL